MPTLWDRVRRRPMETLYERALSPRSEEDGLHTSSGGQLHQETFRNFLFMALLFSANHGCVVSCLSLATSRLGSLGNWQSGVLYLTYTGSALFGATLLTKRLGPRMALTTGMALYCFYVGAFWIGTVWMSIAPVVAIIGGAIGGVGAGVLWTAQGAFFARAAEQHAQALDQPTTESTAKFASAFAFIYLALELGLRSLSSLLLQVATTSWSAVFGIYFIVALASTVCMVLFIQEPPDLNEQAVILNDAENPEHDDLFWYKITAAFQLLRRDRKMQCMIGLNAVFGFTSAFLNSYINGEVVPLVLDDDGKYLGLLTSWVSAVAAVMSLAFGRVHNKGTVLTIGALCFLGVALPFLLFTPPTETSTAGWGLSGLVMLYTLHGTGRATFEGTLKGTFADFFPQEKEGAFANIILQNGLASALGFVVTNLTCEPKDSAQRTCVAFHDGTYHNIRILEWMVIAAAALAIAGYWKADQLHNRLPGEEEAVLHPPAWTLVEDQEMVTDNSAD